MIVLNLSHRRLPLLTRSVPDLELYCLVVHVQLLNSEIDSDCWEEALVENIVCKPAKDVRLSCTAVTNDENFEDVIVFLVHSLLNDYNKNLSKYLPKQTSRKIGVWGLGFGVWGLGFGEIGRAHV